MKSNETINSLLKSHEIKLTKSLGQNFLVDANITKKIVEAAGVDSFCGVLEVGPGLGALTRDLSETAGHVTAVELDKRFIPLLNDMFDNESNVSIIHGDILKLDIKKLVNETMSRLNHHVCANLPYNITTPVLTAFLDSNVFSDITVMMQKEVALRICAKPGSKEYGAFTVYINYHTEPEILFDVSPGCFMPCPKVTSTVVTMKVRNNRLLSPDAEKTLFRVVRAAFGQRRKTLVNALFTAYEKTHKKEDLTRIITSCGFESRIRGEVLNLDDFIKLSSKL